MRYILSYLFFIILEFNFSNSLDPIAHTIQKLTQKQKDLKTTTCPHLLRDEDMKLFSLPYKFWKSYVNNASPACAVYISIFKVIENTKIT